MYSIENTKEVLGLGFAVAGALKNAKADGKLGLEDVVYVMPIIQAAGPAVDKIGEVPKELADLSANEVEELMLYARGKLGEVISDDALKVKIEKGLKAALAIGELVAVL